MTEPLLHVEDLRTYFELSAGTLRAVDGVSFEVHAGRILGIVGESGSGKSATALSVMRLIDHPGRIVGGRILFKGEDVTAWPTDVRAKAGMFLAFQYPEEIAGVPMVQFLKQALAARTGQADLSLLETRLAIMEWMRRLEIDPSFGDRFINQGFSGGEKKRNEILQMAILEPDVAILDETDSGLDIDALRSVARGVREVRAHRPELGIVLITHYQRILDELQPDRVHLLIAGRIVASGGPELGRQLEAEGYEAWRQP